MVAKLLDLQCLSISIYEMRTIISELKRLNQRFEALSLVHVLNIQLFPYFYWIAHFSWVCKSFLYMLDSNFLCDMFEIPCMLVLCTDIFEVLKLWILAKSNLWSYSFRLSMYFKKSFPISNIFSNVFLGICNFNILVYDSFQVRFLFSVLDFDSYLKAYLRKLWTIC